MTSAANGKRGARRKSPARVKRRAGAQALVGSTRERLVKAAGALLEEGGYAAASVQAIADRIGVSAGALYRHFPSKAELVVEVFRDAARRDLKAIDGAASVGSCIERLEAAVAAHARRALHRRRFSWALLYEPVDPLVDEERLVYRRTYCRHMAGLLRQGIAAGEIPEQDVELTAAAVVGAIAESLVGPLSPVGGRISSEEHIIATLVRFCRRSVGAPDSGTLRNVKRPRKTAR